MPTLVEANAAQQAKEEVPVTVEIGEVEPTVATVGMKIEISSDEKLAIRELENKFLKSQMELNHLQTVMQEIQRNFPAMIEQLKQKYAVDPVAFLFDSATLEFRRK